MHRYWDRIDPCHQAQSKGNGYLVGTDRKGYSKPLIQEAFDK